MTKVYVYLTKSFYSSHRRSDSNLSKCNGINKTPESLFISRLYTGIFDKNLSFCTKTEIVHFWTIYCIKTQTPIDENLLFSRCQEHQTNITTHNFCWTEKKIKVDDGIGINWTENTLKCCRTRNFRLFNFPVALCLAAHK